MADPTTPTPGTPPERHLTTTPTGRDEIINERFETRFPEGFPNPFLAKDVTGLIYIIEYIDEVVTEEMLAEACIKDFR